MTLSFARRTALLVVLPALVAACTESDPTRAQGPQATVSVDGSTDPSGAQPTTSPSASPSEDNGITPVTGTNPFSDNDQVLTVAIKDPATLDPMLIGDPGSTLVARQLYEGLTRWDAGEAKVVPAVAESWKVADGGAKFTFKLRSELTFHDGSAVTAHDFVFAFNRIAQRRNASELAYLLQRVKGFAEVNEIGKTKHLVGIRAPDNMTLVIELTEPDQDFPAALTHPGLVPLVKEAVANENEFLRNPVGNGPFKMAQPWDVGGEIYLQAFSGGPEQPSLDGLRLIPYPEAAVSWLDFLEAQLDVSEAPAGQLEDAAKRFGDENFQPLMNGYAYGLNVSAKKFKNANLRKAINLGIDRAVIGKVVYNGVMKPARGIVPPGVNGFEKDLCEKLCSFAPKKAKELISTVPAADRDLTLQFPNDAPHDEVAKLVRRNLNSIGFDVTLDGLKFKEFFNLLQTGKHSVYRLTWLSEYQSPDAFLGALFESSSPDNHSGFSSGKVDALLAKARSEPKPKKRLDLYRRVEKLVLEAVPIVPLGFFTVHWAAQPEVQGFEVDSTGGFDAVSISLEEQPEES